MTPEERITALEVKLQNVEKDIEDMKTTQNELLQRLSNIEKRIALWTGGIIIAGYILEHLLKLIQTH